jgi:transposase
MVPVQSRFAENGPTLPHLRSAGHGSGLGKVVRVVERFFGWLYRFGRLRPRTDHSAQMQDAFLNLASANLRKDAGGFDLPIALALLVATAPRSSSA